MSDVDWVKAAMDDDCVVVELLFSLNKTTTTEQPRLASSAAADATAPLSWTVRQRRSKPIILPSSTRSSPTTPLSWSGGNTTSHSGSGGGGVDCLEESSGLKSKRSNLSRSKVIGKNETTPSKRPRKKTLAELKEDEVVLLNERKHLKRELAKLRITLEKQKNENESLKKIKLDLQSHPEYGRLKMVTHSESFSDAASLDTNEKEPTGQEERFELPDLNLPAADEL